MLGRSASTLSLELKRNNWVHLMQPRCVGRPRLAGGYRSDAAHRRTHACTVKPRVLRRLQLGTVLWGHVAGYLKEGYSPDLVAGTLATVHPDNPSLRVSHETIHTAIYAMPCGELRTEVIGWLRFGHTKRRPRARGEVRRGKIPDMASIHNRPPEIDERLVPGHWEGDLIKGAYNRSATGTLVERTTLFTAPARMDNARAESAVKSLDHVLNRHERSHSAVLSEEDVFRLHHPGRDHSLSKSSTSTQKMPWLQNATRDVYGAVTIAAKPHSTSELNPPSLIKRQRQISQKLE